MHLLLRAAILTLLLLIITSSATPISEQEKKERKEKAAAADKLITHIDAKALDPVVKDGLWLIMFGAVWCAYTQRATPKWLDFQEKFYTKYDPKSTTFNIAKVECSDDETLCEQKYLAEGYPTVQLFYEGKIIEEYMGSDDPEPMLSYFESKGHNLLGIEFPKTTPEPAKSGKLEVTPVALKAGSTPTPGLEKSKGGKNSIHDEDQDFGIEDDSGREKAIVGGSFGSLVFICAVVAVGMIGYRVFVGKSTKRYKKVSSF
ncbi:hypothetical protein HDU97_004912 [Phlyctochytrium planicorne]|nr:hypothetical protein HDU97_004912 [Phlyctochytrium planicorne]